MPPPISPVIVASKAQLEEAIASAFNRAVEAMRSEPERDQPRLGWLTNREAQTALGVSRATLARWRKDGTLKHSKLGASVYYSIQDIEALLASRKVRRA